MLWEEVLFAHQSKLMGKIRPALQQCCACRFKRCLCAWTDFNLLIVEN